MHPADRSPCRTKRRAVPHVALSDKGLNAGTRLRGSRESLSRCDGNDNAAGTRLRGAGIALPDARETAGAEFYGFAGAEGGGVGDGDAVDSGAGGALEVGNDDVGGGDDDFRVDGGHPGIVGDADCVCRVLANRVTARRQRNLVAVGVLEQFRNALVLGCYGIGVLRCCGGGVRGWAWLIWIGRVSGMALLSWDYGAGVLRDWGGLVWGWRVNGGGRHSVALDSTRTPGVADVATKYQLRIAYRDDIVGLKGNLAYRDVID